MACSRPRLRHWLRSVLGILVVVGISNSVVAEELISPEASSALQQPRQVLIELEEEIPPSPGTGTMEIEAHPTFEQEPWNESCEDCLPDCLSRFWHIGECDWDLIVLPDTLLWTPPMANQRAPRSYLKTFELNNETTFDIAIGAQVGIFRLAPEGRPNEGFELDLFAAVFSRFADDAFDLTAADYRGGTGCSYRNGPWQAKVYYEHTSSHLGDEFLAENPGFPRRSFARDEMVFGLGYVIANQLRVYGQYGYAFRLGLGGQNENRNRYDIGFEWVSPCRTGWRGRPFLACDLDFRPEHNYDAGKTIQLGWLWRGTDYGHTLRLALEYYKGRSPYGQLQLANQDENWIAFSLLYDF